MTSIEQFENDLREKYILEQRTRSQEIWTGEPRKEYQHDKEYRDMLKHRKSKENLDAVGCFLKSAQRSFKFPMGSEGASL